MNTGKSNDALNQKANIEDPSKRRFRTDKISNLVRKKTTAPLKRLGFSDNTIVAKWTQIAGAQFSANSMPLKINFKQGTRQNGTLHIMVEGAFALQMQHAIPLLIEKINMYFGYALIAKIVMTQGPVEKRTLIKRRTPKPLDAEQNKKLDNLVARTKYTGLKDALAKLGQNILSNSSKNSEKDE